MKLNWQVVWGAVIISVLIVIGSYFGSHWVYQLDEELLVPPLTLSVPPTTLINTHTTVLGIHADSEPEIVTSDADESTDDGERIDKQIPSGSTDEQANEEMISQLTIELNELKKQLDQEMVLFNKRQDQYAELRGKIHLLEMEESRLTEALEEKLPHDATKEEVQSHKEYHMRAEVGKKRLALEQEGAEQRYWEKSVEVLEEIKKVDADIDVIKELIEDLKGKRPAEN